MTRLLVYEQTWSRVRARIETLSDVSCVVYNDDDSLRDGRGELARHAARPDVAWLALDLYRAPQARDGFTKVLLEAPALKWVQLSGAGMDHPGYAQLFAKGVRITSNHSHAVAIAEFVLASVLDHFQGGPERRTARLNRTWAPMPCREISGANWLVIGFGEIGQRVAARARAMEGKITAVRRDLTPHPLADVLAPMSELPNLLRHADVVVLSIPLNAATENLVNAQFLGAMKAESVLVNVGRGGLIDESALLSALDSGRPAHAVLDVFRNEPLPDESPFWSHPRVALTPHTSSVSNNLWARTDALFFENLRRLLDGRALIHEASAQDF